MTSQKLIKFLDGCLEIFLALKTMALRIIAVRKKMPGPPRSADAPKNASGPDEARKRGKRGQN
jgi:hypothetical protein